MLIKSMHRVLRNFRSLLRRIVIIALITMALAAPSTMAIKAETTTPQPSMASGTGMLSSGTGMLSSGTLFGLASEAIAFNSGWNLISLPLVPVTPLNAETALQAINAQGGVCSEIVQWLNGGWNSHILGLPFGQFPIVMGEGYFVKCTQSSTWTLDGSPLSNAETLNLVSGWNLVGIPNPVGSLSAHDIIDGINSQGGACTEITHWVNGGWESYILNLPFNDFPILPSEGYFVRCTGSSSYTADIIFRTLGQVAVLSTPGDCGGDSCYNLRVSCPNLLQTSDASLKVSEPTGNPYAGTIVFATGWIGNWYWGDSMPISALPSDANIQAIDSNNTDIITHLRAAGYRTVEIKWASNWFQGASGQTEGMARLACRPASIIRWVYDNLHQGDTSTPYCATGQSNGAAQVSYALAQYGLSTILDAVVNESGPNWARVDDHCIYNPSYPSLFGNQGDRNTNDMAFGFPNNGTGPCAISDPAYRQVFYDASLQYGRWQFNYPHTYVAFVFGEVDATATKAQGQAYYDFLLYNTSLISSQTVPGADHFVTETTLGAQVMEDTLKNVCIIH